MRNEEVIMDRVVIFGAAGTGQKLFQNVKEKENVVCFCDNNEKLWGTELYGRKIVSPGELLNIEFDFIYVASMYALEGITNQLVDIGIPRYKIKNDLVLVQTKSRLFFLENFSRLVYKKKIEGAVAEAGVYKGDFSKEINRCFPDRKLYLFDTFEGFSESDIEKEKKSSHTTAEYLKDTSVELVLSKMPIRDNCIVRKGFFPDTAQDIDEKYAFVSLDMDLYKPTLEGLRYFYTRMAAGG